MIHDLGVTYRGAVDAWECDQMEHMNLRFYGRRFSEAEAHAVAQLDLAYPFRPVSEALHCRRELRVGTPLRIESAFLDGPSPMITHQLFAEGVEDLCATLEVHHGSDGMSDAPPPSTGLTECGRGLVRMSDCDGDHLGREGILRLVNQAGVYLGLEKQRQRHEDGRLAIGTAVVLCETTLFADAHQGECVIVDSAFGARSNRSIRVHHDVRTQTRLIARCEAVAVFFDIATRKAVLLPEALRS